MPLVSWGDTPRTLRLGKKTNTFNRGLEVVEDAHTLTQMLEHTYLGSLDLEPFTTILIFHAFQLRRPPNNPSDIAQRRTISLLYWMRASRSSSTRDEELGVLLSQTRNLLANNNQCLEIKAQSDASPELLIHGVRS